MRDANSYVLWIPPSPIAVEIHGDNMAVLRLLGRFRNSWGYHPSPRRIKLDDFGPLHLVRSPLSSLRDLQVGERTDWTEINCEREGYAVQENSHHRLRKRPASSYMNATLDPALTDAFSSSPRDGSILE